MHVQLNCIFLKLIPILNANFLFHMFFLTESLFSNKIVSIKLASLRAFVFA